MSFSSSSTTNVSSSSQSQAPEPAAQTVVVLFSKGRSLTYTGHKSKATMILLSARQSIWKVLKHAMKSNDCRVTCIMSTQSVRAFPVESAAFLRPVLIKTISPARFMVASEQLRHGMAP